MSAYLNEIKNEKEQREGLIWSIIIHLAILFLFFLPLAKEIQETESFAGILVNFGGDLGEPEFEIKEKIGAAKAAEETKPIKETKAEPAKPKNKETKPAIIESNTKTNSAELVAEKPKVEQQEATEQLEKTKEQIEDKVEEKADLQAQEEAKLKEAKSKFGNLFGNISKCDTNEAEEQGDPFGVPDNENLQKQSSGTGTAGEGLNGRGIIFRPSIKDDSNKQGIVMVAICVDGSGSVISANFTQKGSTTTDNHLIQLAIDGAKKYKFTPNNSEEQCGTITIDFVLRT